MFDNDRLTQSGDETYSYDDQGNTLTKTFNSDATTYSYNAKQKLTQATITEASQTNTVNYLYNIDGIRIAKEENGIATNYLVDTNRDYAQVIAETDNNQINVEYTFGDDLISQTRSSQQFTYLYDAQGTTRALANDTGNISDSYFYDAFGNTLANTGTTENNFLYTGEQFDASLSQYYLRARYYDQGVGRFTQQDIYKGRIGEPTTLHKYKYAHNDPANGIDPLGMMFLSDTMLASSLQNSFQGGKAVGLRLTMQKLGKETACFMIQEVAFNEIAEIASGVYIFDDADNKSKKYVGKTNNFKARQSGHGDRVKSMMAKIEFHGNDVLDLFNLKDEKRIFNNQLRLMEQWFMDYLDDLGVSRSNINKSVAAKPKSKNSQQLRRILKNKIDICP